MMTPTLLVATTLVVIVVIVIQSLFGVGVLLFGTPILLLMGHDFVEALLILLPISITINLFQIGRHHRHVDRDFYRNVLIFTVPPIVASLVLVTQSGVDMAIPVGLFLLFVALERYSARVQTALHSLVRYERTYMLLMGVVHGLTNLGGSLLTAMVHAQRHPRDAARATIASAYCTFAIFQVATLVASGHHADVAWGLVAAYVLVGGGVFVLTESFVYRRIDDKRYRLLFATFLAGSGVLLVGRALLAA
jgi:uncharacterized membrane protein YfcA